jgi:hypothetical protein
MVDEDFVYRADLGVTPLPDMLATIHRHGVPGVMEFEQPDESKRVFFIAGDIIFATSSDRGESLGEYLWRKGRITRAQYEVSAQELESSPGVRHGSILVQMGFLAAGQLGAAVREQVQQILWSLFNWDSGEVEFRVGRFREEEVYKITIATPRAILSGCKRIADARVVTARLGGRETVFFKEEWPQHLGGFRLEAGEQRLLDSVDGRKSLYELCEDGPMSPGINARVLYALLALGIVGREQEKKGHIKIQLRSPWE